MEYPLCDFNDFNDFDFDFTDNDNDIMVNETTTNLSKGIEDIGSAIGSNNNQPVIDELNSNQNLPVSVNELHESPTALEPSQMPNTSLNAEVELLSPLTKNEQTQLGQMNVDLDTFGEVPLDQLIASPDIPNESFLHGLSSDPNFEQPIYSGFEGNDNDAHQTTSPPFSPHIMERTNSFPLPLPERLSEDGVYTDQPIYSEPRVNSVQANQFNNHIGSSLPEDGIYTAQSVFSDCRVNSVQENKFNSHIRNSLPEDGIYTTQPVYSEHRVNSVQTNHLNGYIGSSLQAELLKPQGVESANPGRRIRSEANQFQSIGNSDSQRYNFIQPRSSTPSRSQQQLNNPSQLLNQVSNRSNASNSLLQHSMLTKDSMPSQLMSQNFSYQHDQVSMTPRAYNPQTYNTGLAKSSMPLRTSTLAPNRQTNPPNVSDLRYCHSLQPRSSMLSSLRSYQLPRHQQASSEFSMPSLSNSDLYKSNLPESSILQRLQQQQGLLNQPARPTPTYPISGTGTGTGTSLSSIVMNSLPQNETGNTLTPHQVRAPLSNYRERGTSERRQSAPESTRYGLGESSSTFKRFRSGFKLILSGFDESFSSTLRMPQREPSTLPMQIAASVAERENWNLLSTHNEAGTSSNTGNLSSPRPIKNALYDPLFEGIGLPVDPHLRMFATM
ncbi:tpr repeat-containingprotein [Gossypium australe]|uniref:Tpr repeat-containingprotein n=1 Tax=Gossypium australe TaxID=47621 RepID=A0A5B6W642_9ROSI|nr:tpr repeat-containingprotein [Gossypium australe]